MSKAKDLLEKFYLNKNNKTLSEYSWSNPIDSVYVDNENDLDIDDMDDIDLDDEEDCEGCDEEDCPSCYPLDSNTIIPFDDLDDSEDFVSNKFPDLHYDNMSRYYSQESPNPDFLTARSCQMCGKNEKMCGLRYCRPCYDRMRYKRRKILNAPFNTLVPFNTNKVFEAKATVDVGQGEYRGVTAEDSPFKIGSEIELKGKMYKILDVTNLDTLPNIKKRLKLDYSLVVQKANSFYNLYISSDGKDYTDLHNVTKIVTGKLF